jgi:hypothetical protein
MYGGRPAKVRFFAEKSPRTTNIGNAAINGYTKTKALRRGQA